MHLFNFFRSPQAGIPPSDDPTFDFIPSSAPIPNSPSPCSKSMINNRKKYCYHANQNKMAQIDRPDIFDDINSSLSAIKKIRLGSGSNQDVYHSSPSGTLRRTIFDDDDEDVNLNDGKTASKSSIISWGTTEIYYNDPDSTPNEHYYLFHNEYHSGPSSRNNSLPRSILKKSTESAATLNYINVEMEKKQDNSVINYHKFEPDCKI